MTSKNDDDVLEVLMEVRDAMVASGQGPDMPELKNFTGNRDNWYDPRRPLATDVWRVLAGLPRKYGERTMAEERLEMKRFMAMRRDDKYMGELFETREEAEKDAIEQCNGDPGGDFLIFEVVGSVTRPRHPEAVLTRMP